MVVFQPPAGNAGTVKKGHYTRVGNVCYINATFSAFSYSNLTVTSYAQISELPFFCFKFSREPC